MVHLSNPKTKNLPPYLDLPRSSKDPQFSPECWYFYWFVGVFEGSRSVHSIQNSNDITECVSHFPKASNDWTHLLGKGQSILPLPLLAISIDLLGRRLYGRSCLEPRFSFQKLILKRGNFAYFSMQKTDRRYPLGISARHRSRNLSMASLRE